MPRYEVTVQGRGIALPIEETVAVGFLRLVQVSCRDPLDAQVRAVQLVQSEWDASFYSFRNRGGSPYLTISNIGLLSWWHRFLGSPRGYIFFAEDGVQIPARRSGR